MGMTLDEAIRRYTSNAKYERTHGSLQGCLEFRQLADWLKELKQLREKARWIPVSEGLPEDYKTVIASVNIDGREYVFSEVRYSKEFGWEWAYESGADYWEYLNGVDAWMPLPKPYEPQESEE